jgi:hypothetical protein
VGAHFGKGRQYYSGFMGDVQLLMFQGEQVTRDNGEVVQTWKLFAQERDPERRPKPRAEQQDAPPPFEVGETKVHRLARGDPRQEHIDELAAQFAPDQEPGF